MHITMTQHQRLPLKQVQNKFGANGFGRRNKLNTPNGGGGGGGNGGSGLIKLNLKIQLRNSTIGITDGATLLTLKSTTPEGAARIPDWVT